MFARENKIIFQICVIFLFVSMGAFTACKQPDSGDDDSDDKFAVVSISPADGSSDVYPHKLQTIEARFSKEINPYTLNRSNFTVFDSTGPVEGTISSSGEATSFIVDGYLRFDETYTIRLRSGIVDRNGNRMRTDVTSRFYTSQPNLLKLTDTNQNVSYSNTFGEDNDYSVNPPSYRDNGDGTVTDNVTDLMWQKSDDDTLRFWSDSITYCENLVLGGFDDWRLPAVVELMRLLDFGTTNPTINAIFTGTNPTNYWTIDGYHNDPVTLAWVVKFDVGGIMDGSKSTGQFYVRCVRGEQEIDLEMVDNEDGTVTDLETGLIWQQNDPSNRDWEEALAYCETLELAGKEDWRLPSVNELLSLVDTTRYNLSIDENLFPEASPTVYHTSTTVYSSPADNWIINFISGFLTDGPKTTPSPFRCVRGK